MIVSAQPKCSKIQVLFRKLDFISKFWYPNSQFWTNSKKPTKIDETHLLEISNFGSKNLEILIFHEMFAPKHEVNLLTSAVWNFEGNRTKNEIVRSKKRYHPGIKSFTSVFWSFPLVNRSCTTTPYCMLWGGCVVSNRRNVASDCSGTLWYSLRNTTTTPHTVKKTSRNTSEKAVLRWKQPAMFFVEETAISVFVFLHILITSTVYVESFLNDRDLREVLRRHRANDCGFLFIQNYIISLTHFEQTMRLGYIQ